MPNQQAEGANVLTIHYGDMENVIYNTSVYFDNVYSPNGFKMLLRRELLNPLIRAAWLDPVQ